MGIDNLEKFESVNLYFISERQLVTEFDSPVIGVETVIAEKRAVYEFFSSKEDAEKYIDRLRSDYQTKNHTLRLITKGPKFERTGPWLTGSANHDYSHDFEIWHSIECQTIPSSKLPENLETILKNPQRRILKNEEFEVPTVFHFQNDAKPPYNFNLF